MQTSVPFIWAYLHSLSIRSFVSLIWARLPSLMIQFNVSVVLRSSHCRGHAQTNQLILAPNWLINPCPKPNRIALALLCGALLSKWRILRRRILRRPARLLGDGYNCCQGNAVRWYLSCFLWIWGISTFVAWMCLRCVACLRYRYCQWSPRRHEKDGERGNASRTAADTADSSPWKGIVVVRQRKWRLSWERMVSRWNFVANYFLAVGIIPHDLYGGYIRAPRLQRT